MLGDKPWALAAYGVVGLGLAFAAPWWLRWTTTQGRQAPQGTQGRVGEPAFIGWAMALVCAALVAGQRDLLPWRHLVYSLVASLMAGAVLSGSTLRNAAAMFLGLLVASTIPWWLHPVEHRLVLGSTATVVFLLITLGVFTLHQWPASALPRLEGRARAVVLAVLGLALAGVSLVWCLSTGISIVSPNLWAWHHWGAYTGPAELVREGVLPLKDIPLQYGLGVTLLLALLGGGGGAGEIWVAMHWITALASWLMVILLGAVAFALTRRQHVLSIAAALVSVLAACLVWPANAEALLAPTTTPSTSGLRFLPGVLMLALTVYHCTRAPQADVMSPRRAPWWGHVLWVLCFLWSPEAGVHASAVWVPYVVWLRMSLVKGALEAVLAWLIGMAVAMGLYRLGFGEWPSPFEYLVYLLHPPGSMPIDLYGTLWFALSCLGCWILAWVLQRRRVPPAQAGDAVMAWLVMLWCFATFIYYMGRSHDANVINLMYGLVLSLLAVRAIAPQGSVRVLATTLLATSLGWMMVVNPHNYGTVIEQGRLLQVAPEELARGFDRSSPRQLHYMNLAEINSWTLDESKHFVPEDVRQAIVQIRSTYKEPVEVFDQVHLLDLSEPYPPWNALHGPANFVFMPSALRQTYVERVARRLHRPGWLVYQKAYEPGLQAELLANLDAAYRRTQTLDFGSYAAIRFEPR